MATGRRAFPQEDIASAVRSRAQTEIARHTAVLAPTPERNRYRPPLGYFGQSV